MLAILFTWVYTFFISTAWGYLFRDLLVALKVVPRNKSNLLDTLLLSTLGLFILMGVLSCWSLFYRISWEAHIVFGTISAIVWQKKFSKAAQAIANFKDYNKFLKCSLGLLASLILFCSLIHFHHDDNALYFLQSIQWSESNSVVPGLGNLHGRLAFNSNYFLLNALTGFSFFFEQPFYGLSSYLLLVFSLICIELYRTSETGYSHLYLSILFFAFYGYGYSTGIPDPDLAAALFSWITFLLLIRKVDLSKSNCLDLHTIIIVTFGVGLVTIKLSTLPMVFASGLALYSCKGALQRNHWLLLTGIAIFFFLPWIIRSHVLSGYLVYPIPQTDIFRMDWKVPTEIALRELELIRAWARLKLQIPTEVLQMPISEWLPSWLAELSIQNLILIFLCVLSPLLVLARLAYKKGTETVNNLFSIWLISFLGTTYWFLSAPDLRFGYFYISIATLLGIAVWMEKDSKFDVVAQNVMKLFLSVLIINSVFLPFNLFRTAENFPKTAQLLLPQPYPTIETTEYRLGSEVIRTPAEYSFCWNAPVPCAPIYIPELELRADNAADGFRVNKESKREF